MEKYFNTPFWIQAIANYDCQCHCDYCFFPDRGVKPPMNKDIVKAVLDLAYYSKKYSGIDFSQFESNMYNNDLHSYVVSFELAEPLLNYQNIHDGMVDFLHETGLSTLGNATILSNGLALTQERFDFFDSIGITLMLSVDSKMQKQRGYDPSPVIKIIKDNPGKITIRTVIKQQNDDEWEDFFEDLGQYAKDIITQTECRGKVGGPTKEEKEKAKRVEKFFSTKNIKHIHEEPYMPEKVNPNYVHSPTLEVDSDGTMSIMSRFVKKIPLGNIKDNFSPDLFLNELLKLRSIEALKMVQQKIPPQQRKILISHFLGTSSMAPDPNTLIQS